MDFVTIDFETANYRRDSPCEIGLTFVENGKIFDTKTWLIKPMNNEFHFFNIGIHGITPEDVIDSPEFDQVWKEVLPLIENKTLIAHFAGFDIKVLLLTLDLYGIEYPSLDYTCSYIFSKKVWQGLPGYDLKTLCKVNKITYDPHRAGPDSRACAELAIKAFEVAGITSFEEFPDKLRTIVGKIYQGGFDRCRTKALYRQRDKVILTGDPEKHDPESLFYEKKVAFTGALTSMQRNEAKQFILDIGGLTSNSVTKDTDFLIVGQQDFRVLGEDGMSRKQKDAIMWISKGSDLEVLSEDDFLRNI